MLKIVIEGDEIYDEETNEFSSVEATVIDLEHSLLSLSKWESKHQKPFLSNTDKTHEETLDYVFFMIVTPNVSEDVIKHISKKSFDEINEYINSSQSATTFGSLPDRRGSGEVITSELIYYWLVAFSIPFECESWHLNRLFSLIRVCNIKNSKQKKVPRHELAARNRELNARRKAELGTTG